MNEDENCENIHFPPQDREGYVDRNLDKLHPAYIYRDRYDRIKNLNENEKKILGEFRLKVKELKLNDNCLIRYLIARNYKIKDAYDMLIKGLVYININFRNGENKIISILDKWIIILNIKKKMCILYWV